MTKQQADSPATIVTGVILDKQTDKPIANVQVTNGETIILSNSKGEYQIICEQKHIFVQLSLPNGYYGEWFNRINHASQTMNLNFSLTPTPATIDTCKFVQITDTHLTDIADDAPLPKQFGAASISQAVLQTDINHIATTEKPDFIIATGDLTNTGTDIQLSRLQAIFKQCKVPVFPGFGGHDGIDSGEERRSVKKWEKYIGPAYSSWNAGGRHFIFAVIEEGYLHDEQLAMHDIWLKNDLQANKAKEIIFSTHVPPTDEFLALLAPYNITVFLFGHWHSHKVYKHHKMVVCCTPPLVYGGDERTPRSYRKFILNDDQSFEMDLVSVVNTGICASDTTKECGFLDEKWNIILPSAINYSFLTLTAVADKELLCFPINELSRTANQELIALDAGTGCEYWRAKVPTDVHSALTIANNTLYAQTIPGLLSAHNLNTGQALWTTNLLRYPHRFLYTSPVYHDGIIFTGSKGGFTAIDAQTGKILWHNDLYIYDSWACYASAKIYKHLVIVYAQGIGLHAFEQKTGKTIWEFKEPDGNLLHFGQAAPVVFNDILITGTRSGELLGIDLNNGKVNYRKQCSSTFVAGLAIEDDILQIAFADGVVGEWCSRTFENYWTFELAANGSLGLLDYVRGGSQGLIAPLRYKNRRLGFDLVDSIFLLDDQGKLLDQYKLNSPVVTPPIIKANKLWVSCLNGRVSHFELKI